MLGTTVTSRVFFCCNQTHDKPADGKTVEQMKDHNSMEVNYQKQVSLK